MSCPACFSGAITPSLPIGQETILHGLPAYVSSPPNNATPKGLIIFLTDAFGWNFTNNRVLCDHYAQKGGYLVYCPDFMNGNAMDPVVLELMDKIELTIANGQAPEPEVRKQMYAHALPWKTSTAPEITHPGVVAFLQAVRTAPAPFEVDEEGLKIGIAGFCWGGKHAFMLGADVEDTRVVRHGGLTNEREKLVDAIFTAHPSYVEAADVEAVRILISVAIGDRDMGMNIAKVLEMKSVLEMGEMGNEVRVYEGAKHGFAIRTHPENKEEMKSADEAEKQALEWFGRWLG